MTITKEQVRESFAKHYPKDLPLIELAENNKEFWMDALGARHHLTAFELGYTAGAEAKLAELCEGVEMPEPFRTDADGEEVYVFHQLQTAVAAAVAKKEAEFSAHLKQHTADLDEASDALEAAAIERDALTAERDSLREQVRREQLYVQDAHNESKARTAERDALKAELDKCVAAARAAREATK